MKLFLDHDSFVSYVYILFWEYSKKSESDVDKIVWIYFDGKFELFLPVLSRVYAGLKDLNSDNCFEETRLVCIREFEKLRFDDPMQDKVLETIDWSATRLVAAVCNAATATLSEHYSNNAKKCIKNQIWFNTLKNAGIQARDQIRE